MREGPVAEVHLWPKTWLKETKELSKPLVERGACRRIKLDLLVHLVEPVTKFEALKIRVG